MADKNLVQMAVDAYKGRTFGEYSKNDTQEALRNALIEMNGGSTKLNYRSLREHPEMFSLIEEIITKTVNEGLPVDSPIFDLVDERNIALGDAPVFDIDVDRDFIVSEIADGTQGLRRQRMVGGAPITVHPTVKGVKVYEELSRVLSGRIDLNKMIDRVARSFTNKVNSDMCAAVSGAFAGLDTPYKVSGSFDADKLMTLIGHVEAATGQTATVIGSKQAVAKITNIVGADATSAKEDLYNLGYFGHIGVNPVIGLQNGHKQGTTEFILGNDIYVVGTDDKFIKYVNEGDTLIINGDPYANGDLSQEYLMTQRYGVAAVMSAQSGVYQLA
jgi:hypothetical protein